MMEDRPSYMKQFLQFDLTHLLTLQSQLRNFKLQSQLHPIETKITSAASLQKPDMKTHSVYDLSGINNWTKEDEAAKRKKDKGEVAEEKTDAFYIYDPTMFPVLISSPSNDNVANRDLMLAQFEKLTKEELDLLVNKANEEFSMMVNCPRCKRTHSKCMYPAITTMLVELQMKMRQADPTKVTRLVIDKWSETFEKVYDAYQ
jgi:hypothetical protein